MQAAQLKAYEVGTVLYMAMELSNSKWKLGFGNGTKLRRKSIEARDRKCLLAEVALAKTRLKLPKAAQVVCCFAAVRVPSAYSTDSDHPFQAKPATCSVAKRPVVPRDDGHLTEA